MRLSLLDSHPSQGDDIGTDKVERRFTQKKLTIFGKNTYYLQSGRRSRKNPTMLCLHGFLSDGKSLVPTIAEMRYKGRVLVPDMPGFGASENFKHEPSAVQLVDYYDWLKVFIEKTIGPNEEIILVGYSFGAYVAIQYLAGTYKVRVTKSILLTPVVSLQPHVDFYTNNFLLLSRVSERIATNAWRMQHNFTTLYLSRSYRVRTKLDLLRQRKAELDYFNPPLVKSLFEQIKTMNLVPYMRAIDVPLDIILATRDNIAQNSMTISTLEESGLKDVTWHELRGAGHLAPMENHEAVAGLLDQLTRPDSDIAGRG